MIVSSFPTDAEAMQFSLALSEDGHVRCETLRAFEMDEYVNIIQGLNGSGNNG